MSSYTAQQCELETDTQLEQDWLALQVRAETPFFLSWPWIKTWRDCYQVSGISLRIYHKTLLVGLVILCRNKEQRHKIIHSNTLCMNHTGEFYKDQIWSEYNGILVDKLYQKEVIQYCFDAIKDLGHWDEIITGVISRGNNTLYQKLSGLSPFLRWESEGYLVDLKQLQQKQQNYLASISRNTRYKITKARKYYEHKGTIAIEFSKDANQALGMLYALAPLHIERWKHSLYGSGFSNPLFVNFHKNLVTNSWQDGYIDIVQLKAGSGTLGYFYNFIYNDVVYFYLSALRYDTDSPHARPGLLGHSLLIQHYLDNGYACYDFLAGEAQYKQSLSTHTYCLSIISLQRNRLKFVFENAARQIKQRFFNKK